jgi:peptide chain release factor
MWVQISSGKGPDECSLAVGLFLKTMKKEWSSKGISVEVVSAIPGNYSESFKSVLLSLKGDKIVETVRNMQGTICWICKSPYRPKHKRKNWFIDVEVFHEQDKVNFSKNDVVIAFMRSSGPGGQNVNKVETAVRATHVPTGLTVTASEERSQSMNKKLALARLFQYLNTRNTEQSLDNKRLMWSQHNTLTRGNPTRIYEGEGFKLKCSNRLEG